MTRARKVTLGLCLALIVPTVDAANQEIRALFQPDPAQPSKNVFVNKTPNSGYCADWPVQCTENGMFSIQMPVRFRSSRPMFSGDSIALKVPANWRQLMVTNTLTQETERVEVRIIGAGSKFILSDTAANLVGVTDHLEGHQKLWVGQAWVHASPPCQYSGVGVYSERTFRFFWKTPLEEYCRKQTLYTIPGIEFDTLDIAYELRTPNPLGMSSGLYTGSLLYSLGAGGDFELGPLMIPDDNQLTLDFALDVQHTLKVDLPPGGNRVTLEPDGGWASWINSGRKPTKIYRDQMFYISASSRFRVTMLCTSTDDTRCKLGSPKGNTTEVETYLTLPSGISGPEGGDVKLQRLQYNTWLGPYQPGIYLDRKVGSLRFEVPKDAIDLLLKPALNDTLSGHITIIWDSEV